MIGIHDGMPFADYIALDAVNVSALKQVADCPAKVGTVKEQSAAMALGSLTHCAILEPEQLERRYVVTDLARCGTKAWEEAEEAAGGRELVKRSDWEAALRMCDAVWAHPTARALLTGAVTERTLVWQDAETGLLCKARLDAASPLGGPVDVKTAASAHPREWARQARRLRYHWQAAHYLAGCRALGQPDDAFPFIVIESSSPYVTEVYPVGPRSLDVGTQKIADAMRIYAECKRSGRWPGYTTEPYTVIELPYLEGDSRIEEY